MIRSRWSALLVLALAGAAPASADGPPEFAIGGWTMVPSVSVQYDALRADRPEGGDLDENFFRRQRAGLTVTAPGGHRFKAEYEFSSGTWADLFLGFDLGDAGTVRLGQIKPPIGLEVLSSHRTLALLERSPASALLPGRRLGAEWSGQAGGGTTTIAVIGDNLDSAARGHGAFGRYTRQFGDDPEASRYHLGLGAGVEWPDGSQRLRGRPDVARLPLAIADSGTFDADRLLRVALEAAWDRGPFSLQGEYVALRGSGITGDDGDLDGRGSYVQASWRPTGEARRFRNGLLQTLKPARDWGAVELVGRIGWLEVDRAMGTASEGDSISAGANWYLGESLRLMTQFTSAESTQHEERDRIYGARVHYLF